MISEAFILRSSSLFLTTGIFIYSSLLNIQLPGILEKTHYEASGNVYKCQIFRLKTEETLQVWPDQYEKFVARSRTFWIKNGKLLNLNFYLQKLHC